MPMPLGIRKFRNTDYAAFGRRFFYYVSVDKLFGLSYTIYDVGWHGSTVIYYWGLKLLWGSKPQKGGRCHDMPVGS